MTLEAYWDKFLKYVGHSRPKISDQWVPVALVCIQAKENPEGGVDALPDTDSLVLWPAEVPEAQRGPLLADLVKRYQGPILTSRYKLDDQ